MNLSQNIAEKCNIRTCMGIGAYLRVGVSSALKQGFPQCRGCLLGRSGVVRSLRLLLS